MWVTTKPNLLNESNWVWKNMGLMLVKKRITKDFLNKPTYEPTNDVYKLLVKPQTIHLLTTSKLSI